MLLKPVLLTRHASQKAFKEIIPHEHVVQAVREGMIRHEGRSKFKAVIRKKGAWIIAVCEEYPDRITVITVIRKQGGLIW